MENRTLFENDSFLIVYKQPMELSVPSRFQATDERPCLLDLMRKNHPTLLPVHRLDFEVSGLVLFAKSSAAQSIANRWFEEKQIRKTYQAFTEKQNVALILPEVGEEVLWQAKLVRGKKRAFEAEHGKESLTKAKIIKIYKDGILEWNLSPLTGRSHQLRYELYRHGCPILGDELYGAKMSSNPGIALRAVMLDFENCPKAAEHGLPAVVQCKLMEHME